MQNHFVESRFISSAALFHMARKPSFAVSATFWVALLLIFFLIYVQNVVIWVLILYNVVNKGIFDILSKG